MTNIDKFRQSDSHQTNFDGDATEIDNGRNVRYSSHFISRVNSRRVNQQNLPLPLSSVKVHIKKAHNWLEKNNVGASGKLTDGKFCFIHKATGHKIVTYVRGGKIEHETYLDHTKPVDDFERPKYKGQVAGKKVLLDKLIEAVLERFENKHLVYLD
jgi:hypothetical protein